MLVTSCKKVSSLQLIQVVKTVLYNFLKKRALPSNKFSHETSVYNLVKCGAGLMAADEAECSPSHVSLPGSFS